MKIKKTDLIALLLVSLYLFFFGLISILKYNSFGYDDQDLAIYAQTLHNILHGSIESSILRVPFLGNHLNFILFLIVPIYAVFKSPITLLLLQTMALGFSGYPIYLIAKEQLPKKISLLLLFAYLFYPCLGYVNLYEFHIPPFATFFLAALLYAIYKNRFRLSLVFLIFALLCQENIPFVTVPLGVYLLIIKKPPKWWLTMIIVSGIWFWLSFFKLIPYFSKGVIQFIAIYGHLGGSIAEVVKNILTHPIMVLKIILIKKNLIYLTQIFGPVAFLPILNPISFLGATPTLFQHLLSLREVEHTIYYHYTAEIIPFVFFSSIFALKKVLSFYKKENFIAIALLIVTIGANLIIGPHIKYLFNLSPFYKTDSDYVKEAFLKKIPDEAETVATFEFLPKLSHRRKLYSLQHVVTGVHTLSNIPYELPKTTEYAIVDFEDWLTFKSTFYKMWSGSTLRQLFIEGDFGIVNMLDTIALFKRGIKTNYRLYRILSNEPLVSNKLSGVVNSEIEFIGYEADKTKVEQGVISFKFYWRCLKDTDRIYGAVIDMIDKKGRRVKRAARCICYRVYPSNEWKQGQIMEEFYRLTLPVGQPLEDYQIKMGIFDYYRGRAQRIESTIPGVVDEMARINLIR